MNSDTIQKIKDLQLPSRFEEKLLASVHFLLSYELPDLESIILFGSCARKELRVTSDIDLLVITTNPLDRMIRGDISSALEEEMDGVRTDVIFYTREQYDNSNRLFTEQVKRDGLSLL